MALEAAKQAYLVLSPVQRVAFEQFVAESKVRNNSKIPHDIVKLVNGAGIRRGYNGRKARIVAGSQRSGGWVDVQLDQSTEKIPWRRSGCSYNNTTSRVRFLSHSK